MINPAWLSEVSAHAIEYALRLEQLWRDRHPDKEIGITAKPQPNHPLLNHITLHSARTDIEYAMTIYGTSRRDGVQIESELANEHGTIIIDGPALGAEKDERCTPGISIWRGQMDIFIKACAEALLP